MDGSRRDDHDATGLTGHFASGPALDPMNPLASPETFLIRRTTFRMARVAALIVLGALIGLALDLARLEGLVPGGIAVALAGVATLLLAVRVARVMTASQTDDEAGDAEARHAAEGDPD